MNSNSEMPFLDHLDELRSRLTKVALLHIIVMVIVFTKSGDILRLLLKLNPEMQLVFIEPSEIMVVYMQIAMVGAATICSPFTIHQIWAFVSKGLYDRERHFVIIAIAMGAAFFVIGVVFGYMIVVPFSLQFFTRISIEEVPSMVSVKSYISFILTLLLSLGVVFNMPSLVYVATKVGILKPSMLKEYSKIIIVIIFAVAAIVTPPDVVSQLMIAIPMVALLQISIMLSTNVYNRKMRKENRQS
ncbi:MAG: twin-arginine translocase subunit TatC [Tissierellia bacterium]|nr:twin-arginine translocase subunit TatC [Tissierellia bacterium]